MILCLLSSVLAAGCVGPPAHRTPESVTGVVVDVTSRGLGKVTGFVLKDGGSTYDIAIDPSLEYRFPLDHLNEHRATGAPVHVRLKQRGNRLVAISIDDA